jgi:Flp pilus assembly pilin Flp
MLRTRRYRGAHTRRKEMAHLVHLINSFRRNEKGQDLLEYALLVALIALVATGAVTLAGSKVSSIFAAIVAALPIPS